MRTIAVFTITSAAIALAACGRESGSASSTALSADLKRDLAAASATGVELAGSGGYQRTRFVSAIEQTNGAAMAAPAPQAHTKTRTPHHTAAPREAAPDVVASSEPEPQQAEAPQPVATQPEVAVAPAPSQEPTIATPRPSPVPVSYPSGGGSGNGGYDGRGGGHGGGGEVLGGIIGVIIRGGNGGVDHCDPRTDGRRGRGGVFGGGIPINPIGGIGGVIDRSPPWRRIGR